MLFVPWDMKFHRGLWLKVQLCQPLFQVMAWHRKWDKQMSKPIPMSFLQDRGVSQFRWVDSHWSNNANCPTYLISYLIGPSAMLTISDGQLWKHRLPPSLDTNAAVLHRDIVKMNTKIYRKKHLKLKYELLEQIDTSDVSIMCSRC